MRIVLDLTPQDRDAFVSIVETVVLDGAPPESAPPVLRVCDQIRGGGFPMTADLTAAIREALERAHGRAGLKLGDRDLETYEDEVTAAVLKRLGQRTPAVA